MTGQIEKMNLRVIKKEKLIDDQIEDEAVMSQINAKIVTQSNCK